MADEEFDITKYGEAVDAARAAEQADLGRATDLSFLGEAGTDPVGAGQAGAPPNPRRGCHSSGERALDADHVQRR